MRTRSSVLGVLLFLGVPLLAGGCYLGYRYRALREQAAWPVAEGRAALPRRHLGEVAVAAALRSGQLGGAAIDVFGTEPLPAGHPFWTHPSIAVTPHTSARTLRDESIAQIAGKIRALEQGEPIAGIVDPVRGY